MRGPATFVPCKTKRLSSASGECDGWSTPNGWANDRKNESRNEKTRGRGISSKKTNRSPSTGVLPMTLRCLDFSKNEQLYIYIYIYIYIPRIPFFLHSPCHRIAAAFHFFSSTPLPRDRDRDRKRKRERERVREREASWPSRAIHCAPVNYVRINAQSYRIQFERFFFQAISLGGPFRRGRQPKKSAAGTRAQYQPFRTEKGGQPASFGTA